MFYLHPALSPTMQGVSERASEWASEWVNVNSRSHTQGAWSIYSFNTTVDNVIFQRSRSPNVDLMLARRLRRWPIVKPVFYQHLGVWSLLYIYIYMGSWFVYTSRYIFWCVYTDTYIGRLVMILCTDWSQLHTDLDDIDITYLEITLYSWVSNIFGDQHWSIIPSDWYRQTPWYHAYVLSVYDPPPPWSTQTTQTSWPECDLPHCRQ